VGFKMMNLLIKSAQTKAKKAVTYALEAAKKVK
jgi:hypothetical protein